MNYSRASGLVKVTLAVLFSVVLQSLPAQELMPAAQVQLLTEQWVRTKKAISEEAAQWQQDQQHMQGLLALWQKELVELEEIISSAGSRLEAAEGKKAALKAEQQQLRSQRALLKESIEALEAGILELLPRFPEPLQESIFEAATRLQQPATERSGVQPRPLQERYSDVMAILNEAVSFDRRLTLASQMRSSGGKEYEVQVLYFGLAQAFYVDRSGKRAGIAVPAADGWIWTEQRSLAPEVRKAIAIYQNKSQPELVQLPIKFQ